MPAISLSQAETASLATLLHRDPVTIVWDINAFYFVTSHGTYKLECISEAPAGADSKYDEVFSCRFMQEDAPFQFVQNEPGYSYKIINPSTVIQSLTIIEATQAFPSGTFLPTQTGNSEIITTLCLGLLITTAHGIIPALLLPDNFGFHWLEKHDFYSTEEITQLLDAYPISPTLKQVLPAT